VAVSEDVAPLFEANPVQAVFVASAMWATPVAFLAFGVSKVKRVAGLEVVKSNVMLVKVLPGEKPLPPSMTKLKIPNPSTLPPAT